MDALRIKTFSVAGGVANTHLAVTGINANDILIAVQRVDAAHANLGGVGGEFYVEADGYINNQVGGTNTTGYMLLVMWYNMNHYRDEFSGDTGTLTGRSAF